MNPPYQYTGDSFVFPSQPSYDFSQPAYSAPDEQYPAQHPLTPHPHPHPHPHPQLYQPQPLDYQIDPLLDPSLPPPLPPSDPAPSPLSGLRIKLPPMAPTTRGAARHQPSQSSPPASGSEYHESNASMAEEDNPNEAEEEEEEAPVQYRVSSRGRRVQKKSYRESASEDDPIDLISPKGKGKQAAHDTDQDQDDDDEEAEQSGRYALRRTRSRGHSNKLNGFIVSDEEDGPKVGRYHTRNRSKNASNGQSNGTGRLSRRPNGRSQPRPSSSRPSRSRLARRTRSSAHDDDEEEGYVDDPSSGSADGDGSLDEAPVTPPEELDADADADADGDADPEPEQDGKPYALRQRAKINYAIPPPLEEMRPPPKPRSGPNRSHGRNASRPKPPGWSATGAELSRWMGGAADDSVRSSFLPLAYH